VPTIMLITHTVMTNGTRISKPVTKYLRIVLSQGTLGRNDVSARFGHSAHFPLCDQTDGGGVPAAGAGVAAVSVAGVVDVAGAGAPETAGAEVGALPLPRKSVAYQPVPFS